MKLSGFKLAQALAAVALGVVAISCGPVNRGDEGANVMPRKEVHALRLHDIEQLPPFTATVLVTKFLPFQLNPEMAAKTRLPPGTNYTMYLQISASNGHLITIIDHVTPAEHGKLQQDIKPGLVYLFPDVLHRNGTP